MTYFSIVFVKGKMVGRGICKVTVSNVDTKLNVI